MVGTMPLAEVVFAEPSLRFEVETEYKVELL